MNGGGYRVNENTLRLWASFMYPLGNKGVTSVRGSRDPRRVVFFIYSWAPIPQDEYSYTIQPMKSIQKQLTLSAEH